jgi:putative transcriptional regulator
MAHKHRIIRSLESAVAHAKGDDNKARSTKIRVPDPLNVRAIRKKLGLTQEEFAMRFGLSLSSLRNWEQGHRRPQGPCRTLLTLIDRIPEQVSEALCAAI